MLRRAGWTAIAVAVLASLLCVLPGPASARSDRRVDPFIGSGGGPPFFSGNTHPATGRPFGMVWLGPDTTSAPDGSPSAGASGYRDDEALLRGFSATHLSGAGCPAFGDVPVLPFVGTLPGDPSGATVPIIKGSEEAAPGSYAVRLGNGVRASMSAGDRSGLMRFAFGSGRRARLLVKADGSLAGTTASSARVLSKREIAVRATSGGFCGSPNTYRVFVVLRFAEPFGRHGTWPGGVWVNVDRVTRVQVGVSFVSIRGATRNLEADRLGWSVDRLATRSADVWKTELDRIRTRGGTPEGRRLFDSALYRVLQHPSTVSDADGRYLGFDGTVRRLPDGERQLSGFGGWDYYRTHAPLLAWIRPDVASEVVRSLLRAGREGGRLPKWPLVADETHIMNGDSAAPVVATTHAFGARDFDLVEALERLVRQGSTVRDQDGFEPRPGLADFLADGYVPEIVRERGLDLSHGGSTTLEYALDDFAISRLAAAAGRDRVNGVHRERSGSWRSLLDPGRRQLVARDADGDFPPPEVDVNVCCLGFEEGNSLQYTWGGVPHDMSGLLAALGTPAEAADRLDDFFAQLNAGTAPYAWMGNQPSLATPWTYYWLGLPARGQDVVDRIRAALWSPGPEGIPGNDDLGALSAWYVWTSLGLYPVTPGTASLAVGVPAFTRIVVRPSWGGSTTIRRSGTGAHVLGARVDGTTLTRSWLAWGPKQRARHLTIATTDALQPLWGTGTTAVPPSYAAGRRD